MSRIFVTGVRSSWGGALCRLLKTGGHEVLVYDNPFNGRRANVAGFDLVHSDIRDGALLKSTIEEFAPEAIYHLPRPEHPPRVHGAVRRLPLHPADGYRISAKLINYIRTLHQVNSR
ncbi:MAG: NAD-dependent epimerase/dehydratase family protein [Chlamydiota bacterium]